MAVIIKGDNNGLAVDGDVKIDKLDFVFGEGVKSASGVSTVRADAEEVAYEEVSKDSVCKSAQREERRNETSHIPKALQTNRAKGLLNIAVQHGVLTSDYQKNAPVWQLGGVADRIGELLELPNKWVVFSELWGYSKKDYLRNKWGEMKNLPAEKEFSKNILDKIH